MNSDDTDQKIEQFLDRTLVGDGDIDDRVERFLATPTVAGLNEPPTQFRLAYFRRIHNQTIPILVTKWFTDLEYAKRARTASENHPDTIGTCVLTKWAFVETVPADGDVAEQVTQAPPAP